MRKLLLLRALGGLSEWLLGERLTDVTDLPGILLRMLRVAWEQILGLVAGAVKKVIGEVTKFIDLGPGKWLEEKKDQISFKVSELKEQVIETANRTSALELSGDLTTWTYDASYQLVHEQRSGTHEFDVTYTYDPAGKRTAQDDACERTTYTYDAANQLLTEQSSAGLPTYVYDESGNRIEKNAPAETTYYTWDEDNRLVAAEPPAGLAVFRKDLLKDRPGSRCAIPKLRIPCGTVRVMLSRRRPCMLEKPSRTAVCVSARSEWPVMAPLTADL